MKVKGIMTKTRVAKDGYTYNLLQEFTTRIEAIRKGNSIVSYYYGCPLIVLREDLETGVYFGVFARMSVPRKR